MIHPWNRGAWDALPSFERLPPVLLLAGPHGVGKSAFARALAQSLLCLARPASRVACGECAGCRLFASGNHPDYRLVEPAVAGDEDDSSAEEGGARAKPGAAARWIKVDAVRALGDFLALTSHLGGSKVVLIDPADRLHPSASNALLKTLEEPVNTRFVLVTARPARVPATVRSRCVRMVFALPEPDAARAWLTNQGVAEPDTVLAMAGGAPVRAMALNDSEQLQLRKLLVDRIFGTNRFDPIAAVDALGADPATLLVPALQRWCYDLLLSQATGTVRYYPDCAQILHPVARRAPKHQLLRFLKELQDVARHLEHPLNARLLAERCLIGYRNAITGSETSSA